MNFQKNLIILILSLFVSNVCAMEKEKKSSREFRSHSLQSKKEKGTTSVLTDQNKQWLTNIDNELNKLTQKINRKNGNIGYLTTLRYAELKAIKVLLKKCDEVALPPASDPNLDYQIWLKVNDTELDIVRYRYHYGKGVRTPRLQTREKELLKIKDLLLQNPTITSGSIHAYIEILKEDAGSKQTSNQIALAIKTASDEYAKSIKQSSKNVDVTLNNKRARSTSPEEGEIYERSPKKARLEESEPTKHIDEPSKFESPSSDDDITKYTLDIRGQKASFRLKLLRQSGFIHAAIRKNPKELTIVLDNLPKSISPQEMRKILNFAESSGKSKVESHFNLIDYINYFENPFDFLCIADVLAIPQLLSPTIKVIAMKFAQNPKCSTLHSKITVLPIQIQKKIFKTALCINTTINELLKLCYEKDPVTTDTSLTTYYSTMSVKFFDTTLLDQYITTLNMDDVSCLLNFAKNGNTKLAELITVIKLQLPTAHLSLDEKMSAVFLDLPVKIQDSIKSKFDDYLLFCESSN